MDLLWNSEPRDKLIYQNGGYRGRCMVRDGIGFHPLSPVIADYQNESVPLISLWQGPHDINSYSLQGDPCPYGLHGRLHLAVGSFSPGAHCTFLTPVFYSRSHLWSEVRRLSEPTQCLLQAKVPCYSTVVVLS